MSQVTSPAPPRHRPRTWRRRVLLTLLLLVLVGGAGICYFFWYSSSALRGFLAEIDRQDPGWRLEEIEAKRKIVPDDRNSALHIMAIKKLLGGQSVQTVASEKMFDNLAPEVQLNEQQAAYVRKRIDALKKAAVESRKLKDMPDGRFPINYSVDFIRTVIHGQDVRGVIEILQWDAALRVHNFDTHGAMESCLALHHATRALGDEPLLIPQLIRYAGNAITGAALERTLAQSKDPPTEAALKRMQTALEIEALEPTFLIALRGERAGLHHLWQALTDGKVPIKSVGFHPAEEVMLATVPGYLARQHAAMLRCFNKRVEAAKLPMQEREERFKELERTISEEPSTVRTLLPAFNKVREAERRTVANLRCAASAVAAERYRLAQDRWPESLEALVNAGFLDAVPVDPYDGKPLRLKRTVDGLVVYSVGQDEIDNGGFINRDRPFDVGTDQGFRVWDLSRRRQPPNPPVAEEDLLK